MRKAFLTPRAVSPRNAFNGRPIGWRPRERPKVSATKVPCRCGKWIAPNPTNECRRCYERRIIEQKIARQAPATIAAPSQIEPRTYVINGVAYVSCWNGFDSLNPESETPGNLGSSLLDSSPLRS